MGEVELAWAAGLFEGEGTVTCRDKGRGRKSLYLQLATTDEDVVRRFHEVVGVGTVFGPKRTSIPNRKPIWVWQCGSRQGRELVETPGFLDLLGLRRRERIAEVLALQDASPDPPKRITNDPITGEYRFA